MAAAAEHINRRMLHFSVESRGERIQVECPRCGGRALVSKKWMQAQTHVCTYCSQTFRVPGARP